MTDPVFKPTKPFKKSLSTPPWGSLSGVPWVAALCLRRLDIVLKENLPGMNHASPWYNFENIIGAGMPTKDVVAVQVLRNNQTRTAYLYFHREPDALGFYEFLTGKED